MLTRKSGYLTIRAEPAPPASARLEAEGWAVLPGVFSPAEVAELRRDIDRVFAETAPDKRQTRIDDEAHWAPFRYEMLNRSALCQSAIGHAAILATVEPLLGEDCHVIANTAWRQGPEESRHGGTRWHLDAGPHIPRPAGVPWPDDIPYPIFAIAAHLFLADCPIEAGPTGVIPRSHRSGQAPPRDGDVDLTCNGVGVMAVEAQAGDVALSCRISGIAGCPRGPTTPAAMSCNATTGDEISPNDFAQPRWPTSSPPRRSTEPATADPPPS